MAAYVFRLTAGPSANAETSTSKEYFARKVGIFVYLLTLKSLLVLVLGTSLLDY